jgi:hypothetical protein
MKKIKVIKTVEEDFYTKRYFKYAKDTIDIVAVQDTYSLSSKDYGFEDIEKLKINGVEYLKMSLRDNHYYTYYRSGSDIVISPTNQLKKPLITQKVQPSI